MDIVKILWAVNEKHNNILEPIIKDLETSEVKAEVDYCFCLRDLFKLADNKYDFIFLEQMLEENKPLRQRDLEYLADSYPETSFIFIFTEENCDEEFRKSLIALGEGFFQYLVSDRDFSPEYITFILNNPNTRMAAKTYLNVEDTVSEEPESVLGTVKIALLGSDHGVGCTHATLSIAAFLKNKNRSCKVAVLDLSGTDQLKYMGIDLPKARLENSFRDKDIDIYYATSVAEVEALNYYTYIVLDMGCFQHIKDFSEFARANSKILVVQTTPWKFPRIDEFIEFASKHQALSSISKSINCLFTLVNLQDVNQISKEPNAFLNTYMSHPYYPDETTEKSYELLFKRVIVNKKNPQRKGILRFLQGGV